MILIYCECACVPGVCRGKRLRIHGLNRLLTAQQDLWGRHAKSMTERFQGKDRGDVEIYAYSLTSKRRTFFKRQGIPTLRLYRT